VRRIATRAAGFAAVCAMSAGLLGAGLGAPAAASARTAPGPKFALDDPCTYASRSLVARALGRPVTAAVPSGTILCYLTLGPDADVPPNGRLAMVQDFPGNGAFKTARAQFEDRRAIEELSGFKLSDIYNLGRAAYANSSQGAITVLENKKFGFTLRWIPAGRATITRGEAKSLERIARDVVARARD